MVADDKSKPSLALGYEVVLDPPFMALDLPFVLDLRSDLPYGGSRSSSLLHFAAGSIFIF